MISFRQLDSGTPRDVEVTTDDGDAEMADLAELLDDFDLDDFIQLPDERDAAGNFVFTIPGDEVGELGEVFEPLGAWTEEQAEKLFDVLAEKEMEES